VQDNEIVRVTSPLDNDITNGNLCIKGRFGWKYVQSRPTDAAAQGTVTSAATSRTRRSGKDSGAQTPTGGNGNMQGNGRHGA
jgi:hypothetical protein